MSEQPELDQAEVLVKSREGDAMLSVGQDTSDPDRAKFVALQLFDRRLLMGPRYALAVSEALARFAAARLAEARGGASLPATGTIH